ncbi:MAG: WecB/TagA/CpsF family glycosyltransferase [Opitutus sp.]|nr:WecB/TagA/CpsF family glycosyltransferase [Opitutus sp.]MCS6246377.1 WecB/TagA/CpsF family glycosyltransferase [Opitutus sp.]MCS6273235.1 WecB/TagA/CpsF family glycosyltransferase [Opitutus sp.]MCS6277988.1 WecB/TagA/CpsF family glycosyltransferase [Opitutus sp.]MCS6298904.1 WecB/TagA/CpsF family glycosyltransferase [Opitutus sp.]
MRFAPASAAAASPFSPVPTQSQRWPVGLLGVPFENITQAEAVARVDAMIASRRPHYVVTANVDFLVQARHDVELRRILLAADLVLCDGAPLVWASRWLGNPLPERVAGADVTPLLIEAAARNGHRLFLLGARDGVAAEAAARLRQQHPQLVITGHYSPPFGSLLTMDFAEISRRVRAATPDLVLVSFGCPKQEKWIAKHYQQLGIPVMIGVGATLDFIAGRIKRAPAVMQRTGTECFYRLAQEPRRLFGRYAGDFIHFVPAITRQCLSLHSRRGPATPPDLINASPSPSRRELQITGDLNASGLNQQSAIFAEAMAATSDCHLDLSQVRFLDSTGAAMLVQWHRRLHEQGKKLVILNPSAEVQSTLQLLQLTGYLNLPDQAPQGARYLAAESGTETVVPAYPGGHTLAWQGEITAANAEAVWAQTRELLSAVSPPPRNTHLINIARLQFIDTSGAELMARLRLWARSQSQELRFLGARPDVRNVLEMSGLSKVVEGARR